MSWIFLLFALIVNLNLISVQAGGHCRNETEYNEPAPDYCALPDQPHLGCKNNNQFAAECGKDAEIYTMTEKLKNVIVRQHNVYRNIVARGTHHVLPVAGRMLCVKWDVNLAKLAEYAAKLCSIRPLTVSFGTTHATRPGFNAVYNKYPKLQEQDEIKILSSQLKAWYDEYRYMTTESLNSNHSLAGQDITHITQLIIGPNDRVGCAIVKYEKDDWKFQLMICLYGCYKRPRQLTYDLGKVPGGKCRCGCDKRFKNLCSYEETRGDCGALSERSLNADQFELSTSTTTKAPVANSEHLGTVDDLVQWILTHKVGIN